MPQPDFLLLHPSLLQLFIFSGKRKHACFPMDTDPNFDTIKISPRRVFQCLDCNRIASRKDVIKRDKKYCCPLCGAELVDKTNTETGHDFMEILNI
jgi:hypothetical protein